MASARPRAHSLAANKLKLPKKSDAKFIDNKEVIALVGQVNRRHAPRFSVLFLSSLSVCLSVSLSVSLSPKQKQTQTQITLLDILHGLSPPPLDVESFHKYAETDMNAENVEFWLRAEALRESIKLSGKHTHTPERVKERARREKTREERE